MDIVNLFVKIILQVPCIMIEQDSLFCTWFQSQSIIFLLNTYHIISFLIENDRVYSDSDPKVRHLIFVINRNEIDPDSTFCIHTYCVQNELKMKIFVVVVVV